MRDARRAGVAWTRDVPEGPTAEIKVEGVPGSHRTTLVNMAVLRVGPPGLRFLIGWKSADYPQPEFYGEDAETLDGEVAMAVGEEDVTFVALALDGQAQPTLELIEVVPEGTPKHQLTPRY